MSYLPDLVSSSSSISSTDRRVLLLIAVGHRLGVPQFVQPPTNGLLSLYNRQIVNCLDDVLRILCMRCTPQCGGLSVKPYPNIHRISVCKFSIHEMCISFLTSTKLKVKDTVRQVPQ
uniref:Uncharacterized protein n=1 Tax=Kalanchoe fedtschenkoi TaxID=63787 RepID=A0A7N0UYJ8_KALFE